MSIKRLALVVLLGVAATSALAEVNVSVGIGLPGLVYAQPVPVYAPPPAYVVPRPVYAPPPVMVLPQPMYAPRWRGDDDDHDEWKKWRKHQYKEHRHWRREWGDHDD
ncbi:MAG: hypothetical protein KGM60_06045 [Comamonadaceae bacterium]|nr:hypothetical protein [Comamonadaceae bacterium]